TEIYTLSLHDALPIYGQGVLKKTKFTLNNNDVRHNFLTLGDATRYALGVYKKRISDINVSEELEIKGTILDYAINHVKDVREVRSEEHTSELQSRENL